MIKYGRSNQGRQRYRCRCCGKAFNENTGTLFYRRRKSPAEILETLSLLSKGTSISAIKRAKGYKEDTINSWLLEAAEHMDMVSEALMRDYEVSACQIDGLWSYVKQKERNKKMRLAAKQV